MPCMNQAILILAFITISLTASLPPSLLLEPFSQGSTNLSIYSARDITCDESPYGQRLEGASCRDVLKYMPKDNIELTFADRTSTLPKDGELPYRMQSSML